MEYTITSGTIVDGTGSPAYPADVTIRDGAIAAIGPSLPRLGEVIDARGKVVCPGFIDMHSHSAVIGLDDPDPGGEDPSGSLHRGDRTGRVLTGANPPPGRALWRTHLAGLEGDPPVRVELASFADYRAQLRDTAPTGRRWWGTGISGWR